MWIYLELHEGGDGEEGGGDHHRQGPHKHYEVPGGNFI